VTIDERRTARSGLVMAVVVCSVIGAAVVGATLYAGREGAPDGDAPAPVVATEEYGRRLLRETPALLGQDHPDPARRYIGNRLACASCHLDIGTDPGTLTLLQTTEHYPRFSGRAGVMTDIEDRINECMTRSMHGKPLAMDSPEMIAMAAYLRSLGDRYSAMGAGSKKAQEPAGFKTPARRADLAAGQVVYTEKCSICHGGDGGGLLSTGDLRKGYLFPPLWGPDSFNDGAGMARVLTASRFIKARMPLGEPDLTDDQAFDVAGYISSKPRPQMSNLEQDYPDRSLKPIDNGYGPFADSFPVDQHKYGPFQPIEEYYKSLKARR
jgi:thiosulfate dehydrogenase